MSRDHYRVDVAADTCGCRFCGAGKMWTVIYTQEDGEIVEIGSAWGDEELVGDICELMNMAFDAGTERE